MNAQEVETYPLVRRVGLTDDELRVWLTDGRTNDLRSFGTVSSSRGRNDGAVAGI